MTSSLHYVYANTFALHIGITEKLKQKTKSTG